jgi:hypothetical protein
MANNNFEFGGLIIAFIGIVVGLAIFSGSIVPNVSSVTQTIQVTNASFTAGSLGTLTSLSGTWGSFQSVSSGSFTAINKTSGVILSSGNYTITNKVVSNGVLDSFINFSAVGYAGQVVNITFIGEPRGYISDSGGRAVMSMIIIFLALAIAVIAMVPAFEGIKDMF